MLIPKEMEGRYCTFLLQGIPACEVKVKKILPDEIVATYQDEEEVHISPVHLVAWWPDPKRERSAISRKNAAVKRKATIALQSLQDETSESEATETPEPNKDVSSKPTIRPRSKS